MPVSDLSLDIYLLTVSASSDGYSAVIGPVVPKSLSQMVDVETSISAGFSISGSYHNSISGPISTSGIVAELWPPLRAMELVGSKLLTSLEWITTGVRLDTWVTSAENDAHGRLL